MRTDCNRRGFLKGGSVLAASVALGAPLPAIAAPPPTLIGALTAIGADGFLHLLGQHMEADMSAQGPMWAVRTRRILGPSVRATYAQGFSTVGDLEGVASFDRLVELADGGSADSAIQRQARAALASFLPGYSEGRARSPDALDQFFYCERRCVGMLGDLEAAGDDVAPSVLALDVDWAAIRA